MPILQMRKLTHTRLSTRQYLFTRPGGGSEGGLLPCPQRSVLRVRPLSPEEEPSPLALAVEGQGPATGSL